MNRAGQRQPRRGAAQSLTVKTRTSAIDATCGAQLARNRPGAIKAVFRQAIKAITRRQADEPKPSRRRRGESDRALRMAAKATFRRVPSLPQQAFVGATVFLADTLDWLNLWHDADAGEPGDNPDVYRNDLSLRL